MQELLDSKQLRTFVSLARTGSFTTTAKEVFITQSAVSHSMRALETDLGCRLFNRVGKRTTLTLEGEQLLRHAERIIADMKTARASLDKLGKWGETRLRLGCPVSICEHLLPPVMEQTQRRHPKCRITLETGDSVALAEAVVEKRIDLALALINQRDPRLVYQPLFEDLLMFVVKPDHEWVAAGGVARPDIAKQSFILPPRSSQTARLIESYFREEGIILNVTMELDNLTAVKQLVGRGMGISIMPAWAAEPELKLKSLVALPAGRRKLRREWAILHRTGQNLSLVEAEFSRLCQDAIKTSR